MVLEGFEGLTNSAAGTLPGSAALHETWSDWDDFAQKAADLASAAEAVSAQASAPGFTVSADSVEPCSPFAGPATGSIGNDSAPLKGKLTSR